MANWSDLPTDLLLNIASHTTIQHQVVLRAVCTHWGSVLKQNVCPSDREELPWLIIPAEDDDRRCGFYNMSEGKVYPLEIPEFYLNRCCGSSHGWMFMTGKTPSVFMFNPLTRCRIELPPLYTLPHVTDYCPCDIEETYKTEFMTVTGEKNSNYGDAEFMENYGVDKAILSGNPSLEKDYIVMITYSEVPKIGFCRKGDNRWTAIDKVKGENLLGGYEDIVFWRGTFYVFHHNKIVICKFDDGPLPIVEIIPFSPFFRSTDCYKYLVIWEEELLMVAREYDVYSEELFSDMVHCGGHCIEDREEEVNVVNHGGHGVDAQVEVMVPHHGSDEDESTDEDDESTDEDEDDESTDEDDEEYVSRMYGTTCFRIYKPDFEKKIWLRIRDLGNRLLFIGVNSSMSFDIREFPECKRNHIYYTNDQNATSPAGRSESWEKDFGAMDLNTNKIHLLPVYSNKALPQWIKPSLY